MTFTEILADINFLCGTDSTSYSTANKTASINRHYWKAVTDIFKTGHRWSWDDSNLASVPTVTTTMTAATHEVVLPALVGINAIEVKDAAGNWTRLTETTIDDFRASITDADDTPGVPTKYALAGAYIYLYPAPSASQMTLASGLKFWVKRKFDVFTTSDTTQEPGFVEPFHRILSFGATHDWQLINDSQQKADRTLQQYEQLRAELRDYYADQNKDSEFRIRPEHRTEHYI